MPREVQFGFLPRHYQLHFGSGTVTPLEDWDARFAELKGRLHPDGYVYPPLQVTVVEPKPWSDDPPKEVPGSERPALLWPVVASHTLQLNASDVDLAADSLAAYIVHALGFINGYRLQFADWQFDGRIPLARSQIALYAGPKECERLLADAVDEWTRSTADARRRLVNALYLHCRAPSYEWTWEQFTLEYMVTDACYSILNRYHGVRAAGHRHRINAMLDHFVAHRDHAAVTEIVRLRNELQHEAFWAGGRPNYSADAGAHETTMLHRSLNCRLLVGLLGWTGDYLRSDWTDWRSTYLLE